MPRFRFLTVMLLVSLAVPSLKSAERDWRELDGQRISPLAVPPNGKTGFSEISTTVSGIQFTNRLSDERSLTNQIYLNGSGVAAGDVNGDGLCDLYLCGLDSENALYRNLGDWRFENITLFAGVACANQASTGCAFADLDGDRDLDLLVNGIAAGTRLFLNDGTGRFREVTGEWGLRGREGSHSMAIADMDGDGRLDLYVVNYRNDTMRDMPGVQFSVGVTNGVYRLISMNGQPASAPELKGRFTFDGSGGVLENGQPDSLYRNIDGARFEKVRWTGGAFLDEAGHNSDVPYDWGLSALFRDLNGDRAPDLYVCNDFQSPDRIWINDGRGKFRAIERRAIGQTSLFSMGVDVADIDRDGNDDLFVADMLSRDHSRRQVQVMGPMAFSQARSTAGDRPQVPRNTLFKNRGNGNYAEVARYSGIEASDWSWCPGFMDVDLDGYEDLLITTGHWRDAQHADIARELDDAKMRGALSPQRQLEMRARFPRLETPNVAFRNRGDLTFEEVGDVWGFNSRRISQGMAAADLDNDGDPDVVANCLNSEPLLYRNDSERPRISVRLRGKAPNSDGIGARIRVLAPGLPVQSQEIICGGRYLSSDDFVRTFAVGKSQDVVRVEVNWRGGRRSVVADVPANHLVELREPDFGGREANATTGTERQFFEDVSELLEHRHFDAPYDDFARQPLLPRKLSQLGPGLAWFDFNNDGLDDLLIGAGRGGRMAVFRNNGNGGFVRQRAELLETPADRDMTAVLGWRPNPSGLGLLMGIANYEDDSANAPALRDFSLVTGAMNDGLLRSRSSTGPLALADLDSDGDLDLFVGGRVIGGRFPEPASSAILRNNSGKLRYDAELSETLSGVGLVSSGLFSDLNGDGMPELVISCEWGALRLFQYAKGRLALWDAEIRWNGSATGKPSISKFGDLTGWWNSVAAGDFDGDGRMDLVAGNWGRNTFQRRFLDRPLRLEYGDVDGGGNLAIIESHFDAVLGKYVPLRDKTVLSASIPQLVERFPTFASFGKAGLSDILEAGAPPMRRAVTATLDSIILLNRGDHFEARPLPASAQLSPVFGIGAGDFDGDGSEDLFLAQNFFQVQPGDSRQDAGTGLLLLGDGKGGFVEVPALEAAFGLFGEARGAAVCDFDSDGRLDLVVGQNNGETKLFRNAAARPGLRVNLQGPAQNLQCAGAAVRVIYEDGTKGPVKEIRIGGGYWSQDSNKLLFGLAKSASAVEIRWPGGRIERVPVAAGSRVIKRIMPSGLGR